MAFKEKADKTLNCVNYRPLLSVILIG